MSVFDWNNELVSTITTPFVDTQTGKMVFNAYREEMFVTTDGDYVVAIDGGQRSITDLYYVNGLDVDEIFYEPVNEAVCAWIS